MFNGVRHIPGLPAADTRPNKEYLTMPDDRGMTPEELCVALREANKNLFHGILPLPDILKVNCRQRGTFHG